MKYLLHNKRYTDYLNAQEELNAILNEWILAFQKTQPRGTSYGDKVQASNNSKPIEDYVIEVEEKHLYRRINDARLILHGKAELLQIAENELKASKNIWDMIYCKKWVEGKRPKDIYRELDLMGMNYSISQIYEIQKRIKSQIEGAQYEENRH